MIDIIRRYRELPTRNDKKLAWLFGTLLIVTYIPIVQYIFRGYAFALLSVFCLIVSLFSSDSPLPKVRYLLISVFIFIVLSTSGASLSDMSMKDAILYVYVYILFFLPLFMISYLLFAKRYQLLALLALIALAAIMITAITTFVGLNTFPEASRLLATGYTGEDFAYTKYNIGGFEYIYSLVLVVPMLAYLIRNKLYSIVSGICFIILSILLVVKSQYTTASLLLFPSIVIVSVVKYVTKYSLAIALLLMIGITLFGRTLLHSSFITLASVNPYTVREHFIGLAGVIESGSTETLNATVSGRKNAYDTSITSFLRSPIIGNLGSVEKVSGGHSTFLDTLAATGLLGGCLLFLILRYYYSRILLSFRSSRAFGYALLSFILFLILSVLNPTTRTGMIVFFVIPATAFITKREGSI